jgi:hypothetical protein
MKMVELSLKRKKFILITIIFLLSLIIFVSYVAAITANIGNARMILRVKPGDTIDRTILVQNVNDEEIKIDISASGDLANNTKILDKSFNLQPGGKKDARFQIKVLDEGTTETKINVQFTPINNGNGVVLSSNIIIISQKGNGTDISDEVSDESDNENSEDESTGDDTNADISNSFSFDYKSPLSILLIITAILVLLLIILLLISKRSGKKEEIKHNDEPVKPKKRVSKK